MSDAYQALIADLVDEAEALDAVVANLDEAGLATPTPAEGWTITDQLSHLAGFDEAGRTAIVDPDGFRSDLDRRLTEGDDPIAGYTAAGRAMTGAAVRDWWRTARVALVDAARPLDPKTRVPWYGPPMSAMSHVTARTMETWAHGQEVYDVLGAVRKNGDRVRNIVVLGNNTYGWTFKVRGEAAPEPRPHLKLTAPSGEVWLYNDPSTTEVIEGAADEFCQVVTQVRNIADTQLKVTGANAKNWMSKAQCFAGAAEPPPAPGTRKTAVRA